MEGERPRTVDLPPVVVEGEHAGQRVVGGWRRHGLGRGLRHEPHHLLHGPQQEPVRRPAHALRREVRLQATGPPPQRVRHARRHVQRQPRGHGDRRRSPRQPARAARVHLLLPHCSLSRLCLLLLSSLAGSWNGTKQQGGAGFLVMAVRFVCHARGDRGFGRKGWW